MLLCNIVNNNIIRKRRKQYDNIPLEIIFLITSKYLKPLFFII